MQTEKERANTIERVDCKSIILDGTGQFPRKVVIIEKGKQAMEYRLIKTKSGGYILNR